MTGTGPNIPTAPQFNPASGVAAEALWKQVCVLRVYVGGHVTAQASLRCLRCNGGLEVEFQETQHRADPNLLYSCLSRAENARYFNNPGPSSTASPCRSRRPGYTAQTRSLYAATIPNRTSQKRPRRPWLEPGRSMRRTETMARKRATGTTPCRGTPPGTSPTPTRENLPRRHPRRPSRPSRQNLPPSRRRGKRTNGSNCATTGGASTGSTKR